ncbi:hypothetical protein ABIC71_002605 [Herbaspirillum seropedicae]|uniref:hypothetical protein n=1 Tax=Herbaspirillum seropedicae TaxID=964 RepID=UPI0012EA288C|nr:hypothetical protein [Herbaspirillum seropedicae]MDR6395553.1 hypothetical protein [Herbaspirillum seropedicae]
MKWFIWLPFIMKLRQGFLNRTKVMESEQFSTFHDNDAVPPWRNEKAGRHFCRPA